MMTGISSFSSTFQIFIGFASISPKNRFRDDAASPGPLPFLSFIFSDSGSPRNRLPMQCLLPTIKKTTLGKPDQEMNHQEVGTRYTYFFIPKSSLFDPEYSVRSLPTLARKVSKLLVHLHPEAQHGEDAMVLFSENRRYVRFLATEQAFSALGPLYDHIGPIEEISMGGLSFTYFGPEAPVGGCTTHAHIFLMGRGFYLSNIRCKIVYDFPVHPPVPNFTFNYDIQIARCGIQFENLSNQAATRLNFFLRTYTRRDPVSPPGPARRFVPDGEPQPNRFLIPSNGRTTSD
jgi:hypothetical protein